MKFLPEEQQSLCAIIDSTDLKEFYSFRKKKGWVYLEWDKMCFAFHRKEKTILHRGRLMETQLYDVKYASTDIELENWEDVLGHFKIYLDKR